MTHVLSNYHSDVRMAMFLQTVDFSRKNNAFEKIDDQSFGKWITGGQRKCIIAECNPVL
jgi:hypothetical protein